MLSGFVLGCLGLFGFAFAAMTYPNNGLLVALAPFCLSMLIATTAIGAGAIVEAINKQRKAAAENTERLIQALGRLSQPPTAQQSAEVVLQALKERRPADEPHPRSWEAIKARRTGDEARREAEQERAGLTRRDEPKP